jgi:hypothetical protein
MDNILSKSYLEASFLQALRRGIRGSIMHPVSGDIEDEDEGEGKFGVVPPGIDPNSVLTSYGATSHKKYTENPLPHPLLSRSQQFSGIDRRLTANPIENDTARELYPQLRHQHRAALKPTPGKKPPRLVRS